MVLDNGFELLEKIELIRSNGSKDYWLVRCLCGSIIKSRIDNIKKKNKCSCITVRNTFSNFTINNKAISSSYSLYKYNAIKRNYTWDISPQKFYDLVINNCHYCNKEPINNSKHYNRGEIDSIIINGIDRIDNTKGYILNNVVSCCIQCNRAKSNFTEEEFKQWIMNVYNNYINENTAYK